MKTTEIVVNNFGSRKTVIHADSYALHKMLLVVFFHHRASLSLPQLSLALTRSSRASFSYLGLGQHGVYDHGMILLLTRNVSNPGYVVYMIYAMNSHAEGCRMGWQAISAGAYLS